MKSFATIIRKFELNDKKTVAVETKALSKNQQSETTYSKSWQTIESSTLTTQTNGHKEAQREQQQQQLYNEVQRKPKNEQRVSPEQQSWQEELQFKAEHKTNKKKTAYEKAYIKPTKATESEMNIDYDEQQQQQQKQTQHRF